MDRGDMVRVFRTRLIEALDRSGESRSAFAQRAGIDRSTLWHLLSPDNDRLPRAETVATIAAALRVSLDWLLGLSQEEKPGQEQKPGDDILEQTLQIEPGPADLAHERLARWHAEAAGYKVRHVPTTLPDVLKTDEVIGYEYGASEAASPRRAMAESRSRLAYLRLPETNMEVCSPVQAIQGFARGEGVWRNLSHAARRDQLRHMTGLVDELYPSFRWFLYDGLGRYSAPLTVFGPRRAAVYIGQMYVVFNTIEHIRVLTRHFDELIRAAVVQPPRVGVLLRQLLGEIEAAAPSPDEANSRDTP